MGRSLLLQYEQISNSSIYDDVVSGIYTGATAEPITFSGTLQDDLNNLRTVLHYLKNTTSGTNWYDDLGQYFDPTDTDSGNTANKDVTLYNIKGNTLDAKTIIIPVEDDNSGSFHTISGSTTTGVLLNITTSYATPEDRRGLPIFASTANNGSYQDEGGSDNVCRIDIIDSSSDTEIQDGSGNIIYAKFHDGADFSGTGTGTDVYARFYANGATTSISGTYNLKFVYPQRKVMSEMNEYDWLRTDFISSWEGDVELIEDIANLWGYTGASDGTDSTSGSWTDTTGSYSLSGDPSDLQSAIDTLNTDMGDMDWTTTNYVTIGSSLAAAIAELDTQINTNTTTISGLTSGEKYVESVSTLINQNVEHTLPYSITYTPYSVAGQEGKNMDVYVNGQLLAADTGVNGVNADRDYGETTASGITFRFNVRANSNITYIVRN